MYKILQGAEPSFPTLVDFLKAFPAVSGDWLLLGAGAMMREGAQPAPAKDEAASTKIAAPTKFEASHSDGLRVLTVTVDKDDEENTVLFPREAQAGYPTRMNDAVYLKDMKPYHIPGFEGGSYRAFEVDGLSMAPTFGNRDIVVCSYVDRWHLLKPWECYVVVTQENLLLKRIGDVITDRRGTVELFSDNPGYDPYTLPVSDLVQLWQVRGYLSTAVPPRPDRQGNILERLQEVIELLGHDYHEVRRYLEENVPLRAPH
ncbi:MAG: S24 family peptidase [Janthinobacterium lividum]